MVNIKNTELGKTTRITNRRENLGPRAVVQACIPRTWEVEAGE
jgi:hypothetical protein